MEEWMTEFSFLCVSCFSRSNQKEEGWMSLRRSSLFGTFSLSSSTFLVLLSTHGSSFSHPLFWCKPSGRSEWECKLSKTQRIRQHLDNVRDSLSSKVPLECIPLYTLFLHASQRNRVTRKKKHLHWRITQHREKEKKPCWGSIGNGKTLSEFSRSHERRIEELLGTEWVGGWYGDV